MNRENDLILLVEDDEGHRLMIREGLRFGGLSHELRECVDGEAALDYLLRRSAYADAALSPRPALIILDIKLPKCDGFEVLETIKADPVLRSIPVLMLTSTDDQREINRCYALGASSYIVKPIRFEAFEAQVQALGKFLDIMRLPS